MPRRIAEVSRDLQTRRWPVTWAILRVSASRPSWRVFGSHDAGEDFPDRKVS
jgi:hypothetical protein